MVARFVERRAEEALADTPVVLIVGPRRAGKTTLVRKMGQAAAAYMALEAAQSGPAGHPWPGQGHHRRRRPAANPASDRGRLTYTALPFCSAAHATQRDFARPIKELNKVHSDNIEDQLEPSSHAC